MTSPSCEKVVEQLGCERLLYHNEKQRLVLRGCIRRIYVSPFYGEFRIIDCDGLEIAKSHKGSIKLTRECLQNDVARTWYNACSTHNVYKELRDTYDVNDPGIAFILMDDSHPFYLQFQEAFPFDNTRTYFHIPVFHSCTNVWNDETKQLKY